MAASAKKNTQDFGSKAPKNTKNTKNYANIVQCHKETKLVIRCYVINFGILRPVEPESLAAPITWPSSVHRNLPKTGLEGCRYLKIHPKHETGRVPETQASRDLKNRCRAENGRKVLN